MMRCSLLRLPSSPGPKEQLVDALVGGSPLPRHGKQQLAAPARSDAKLGKLRHIQSALDEDRASYEAAQPFSLMESIRSFPWKFFISFMTAWTWAGWYIIPVVKGLNPDGTVVPGTEEAGYRQRLSWKAVERRRLLERKRAIEEKKRRLLESQQPHGDTTTTGNGESRA